MLASATVGCAPQKKHFDFHLPDSDGTFTEEEAQQFYNQADASCWNQAETAVNADAGSPPAEDGARGDFAFGYWLGQLLASPRAEHEAKQEYYVNCMQSKGFVLMDVQPID